MSLALLPAPRNTVVAEVSEVPSRTRELQMLGLWREAIRRTVGSQKAAAIAYGVSTPRLSRQIAGLERVSLTQLARCPEVLVEWSALLAKASGHRLARGLTHAQRQRRIAMRTHAAELARLDLEEAIAEDDALSGTSSALAG